MSTGTTRTVLYQARFELATLSTVRRAVAACLATTGLDHDRIDDMVIAIGEIMGNAVEHGGGAGDVRLSSEHRYLHCLVVDRGPGLPAHLRHHRPDRIPPTAVDGRGLWLAFALCSAVTLHSSPHGTQVDLAIDLPPRDADAAGGVRTGQAG